MRINIHSIAKKERDNFDPLIKEYTKLISKFSKIEDTIHMTKKITQAHNVNAESAQKAYLEQFEPLLSKSYNICLHPDGDILDSFSFSKLLCDKISLNFFIGGAYGFSNEFINKNDKVISLGKLTMSHKVAKVVLYEQIYRGFTILNNHPYHK